MFGVWFSTQPYIHHPSTTPAGARNIYLFGWPKSKCQMCAYFFLRVGILFLTFCGKSRPSEAPEEPRTHDYVFMAYCIAVRTLWKGGRCIELPFPSASWTKRKSYQCFTLVPVYPQTTKLWCLKAPWAFSKLLTTLLCATEHPQIASLEKKFTFLINILIVWFYVDW